MKSITGDILLVGISYDKKHKEHKIEMAYEEAFTYLLRLPIPKMGFVP